MTIYNSGYFEYLAENCPEEAVKEYKRRLLSFEEMCELFKKRSEGPGCHTSYHLDLLVDKQSGLYYVDHNFLTCKDILVNHILVEQLFANKDKVDWKRVTNCYDLAIINNISETLDAPLVWLPTEDVGDLCVVDGKVAAEYIPPECVPIDEGRDVYSQLCHEGLLWFADTLPTVDDIYEKDKYKELPEDMVLWDKLMEGYLFKRNPKILRENLEYIVEHRGAAKAVEIVERFRDDWTDIITLRLFKVKEANDYDIRRLQNALFAELDRQLRIWKKKAADERAPSIIPQSSNAHPLITPKTKNQSIGKSQSFASLLQCPKDQVEPIMARLHELLDNRGGKQVAMILMAAKQKDSLLLDLPTRNQYESEFALTGTWRAVSDYIKKHTLSNGKFEDDFDHILIR